MERKHFFLLLLSFLFKDGATVGFEEQKDLAFKINAVYRGPRVSRDLISSFRKKFLVAKMLQFWGRYSTKVVSALLTLPSWVRFWHPQVNYESKRLKEKRPSMADWIAPIKRPSSQIERQVSTIIKSITGAFLPRGT